MRHLRIYEAYTPEQYQKALIKIGDWIKKSKPKEDILMYINTLTGEDAKSFDQLRILFNRVMRELEYKKRYILYNPRENPGKKPKNPNAYYPQTIFDRRYFYCWDKGYDEYMANKYDHEYGKYRSLIESISKEVDVSRLLFLCDRFFEIFKWCVDCNTAKSNILQSSDSLVPGIDKVRKIDELNTDIEMENEVEEMEKIVKRIQIQIKKIISQ